VGDPSVWPARNPGVQDDVDFGPGPGRPGPGNTLELLASGSLLADRFEIVQPAAAGGMGVVYRARDLQSGEPVALKTLRSHLGEVDLLRFEREARLLAELEHPSVVRHIAHGRDGTGAPYLVMEWLSGESLAKRLERGPLPQTEALSLATRVAEALEIAHTRGLVHRDIKPSNLFLVDGACSAVKLLDFGLCRSEQAPREVTQTGFVLGSPGYISPEQALGKRDVDARADVFALGCVLFESLTGRPAFAGDSALQALSSVLLTTPPRLTTLLPATPPALDGLVAAMLSKEPDERPADGGEVLAALAALSAPGGATGQPAAVFEHRAERLFDAPADLVWALLTDSNRWNRLIGSPPTTYRYGSVPAPHSWRVDGVARIGEAELLGVPSRWLELGEWIEGACAWGERRFLQGLFEAVRFQFEVADATPEGGDARAPRARVLATLTATAGPTVPADAGQFLLAHMEKRLERYFKALETLLAKPHQAPADEPPAARARWMLLRSQDRLLIGPTSSIDEAELAARQARLPAHGSDPVAVALAHLLLFLRHRPDDQVAQIRPLECARLWGTEPAATVQAFLEATRAGLVELRWQLRCPVCRVAAAHASSLATVESRGQCQACQAPFALDLSGTVEGVFGVHPALRAVTPVVYCTSSPIFRPHVVASLLFSPGEEREVQMALPDQDLTVRVPRQVRVARLPSHGRPSRAAIDLHGDHLDLDLEGAAAAAGQPVIFAIHNHAAHAVTVLIERTVPEQDVLLATELCLWPGFRQQFADQVPAEGVELQVSSVTVVSAELCDVDGLCRERGDAAAAATVVSARRQLRQKVEAQGGSVTEVMGGRLLASFGRRDSALAAARAMVRGDSRLAVRAGLLEGSCVAVQADERLELFGRVLGEVSRAMESAQPGELVVLPAA
jgi:hypothetical protein